MEFEKIREVISEQMNIDEGLITMETDFTEDLGADSLDIFQVIAELEDLFGIEFDEETEIRTIGDAVNYIKESKNK